MHCPQCGQQQAPGEVRFCSRCGFPLSAVSEVVARGGMLPVVTPPGGELSPRQRGVRQGVFLMLSTALVVPFVFFLLVEGFGFPDEMIPLAAIFCAVGGFLRMLYALLFESNARPLGNINAPAYVPPYAPGQMNAPPPQQHAALPAPQQRSVPVSDWRQRPDTSEMASRPASVTENTTRLLDERPAREE